MSLEDELRYLGRELNKVSVRRLIRNTLLILIINDNFNRYENSISSIILKRLYFLLFNLRDNLSILKFLLFRKIISLTLKVTFF